MKVAHVPYTFAPDPVGGTEIYVEALAQGLRAHGVEPLILAPSVAAGDAAYEHNGLRVRRFRPRPKSELREFYGAGDPEAAAAFAHILDEERPDAVHVHAFTRAVSILLVRAAKERGLPVYFTYHTPTVSCQRGTLMVGGEEVCDGVLHVRRCTSCYLEDRGAPRWASVPLSHVPALFGRALDKASLRGGIWTALRMSELMRMRHQAFQALVREVDRIVVLSEWARALLLRNGVSDSKLTLSRHGLPSARPAREPLIDVAHTPLRVAFLGRADPVKGADTLIKAVRTSPDLSVELHLYGVVQSATDAKYWTTLQALAARDARIRFFPPVAHDQVISLLRGYHLLAVPSRWLETGPLVALESFAAGTPVIGSKLGGITECVQHNQDGLLLPNPEDVRAWADALWRCTEDRGILAKLRDGVRTPRDITDVAQDMAELYRSDANSTNHSNLGPETSGHLRHIA